MDEMLLHSLSSAPKIVERILRVFPHDRLDDRIDPDRFTAREVIAHLADYEQTVLDRIRVAKLHSGREVPWYDPDGRCEEHGFASKEVFHEGEVFESRRGMTIDYVNGLEQGDFDLTFARPDGTTTSIREYLTMVVFHDLEHLEQLSGYLATEVATSS